MLQGPAEAITESNSFRTLPDRLAPGLDLVLIGINPGLYSVEKGHYFARKTSRFWPAFSRSKLSGSLRRKLGVDVLRPEHDAELPRFGIGLTDIVKRPTANIAGLSQADFETEVPRLVKKLQHYAPRMACFHGIMGYRQFLRFAFQINHARNVLGPQPESIGATHLFVVPNPSPANAHFTVEAQTQWYDRVAEALERR
ncbi:MAG TPA: mismatch-specific DNA-glycosylase [Terriglobales bacterium]|nr:mismatch-specific DNA-glycosylase [Terriglobales bacterium]